VDQTPLFIRRAAETDADVDLVAPLFDAYRQFYEQKSDIALAKDFIAARLWAEDSVVFLALADEDAADALGFAQLYPSWSSVAARPIWILNDLFVAPAARGRGVGHALLERCRRYAVETGAQRMALETLVGNRGAQRLYESLGWRCQNDVTKFYELALD
jgi:GNAT superfamily N-acetyltransferase